MTFTRLMFAPAILATVRELADKYQKENFRVWLIARDTVITTEFRIRSKHGTWRFFPVMPDSRAGTGREGDRI